MTKLRAPRAMKRAISLVSCAFLRPSKFAGVPEGLTDRLMIIRSVGLLLDAVIPKA